MTDKTLQNVSAETVTDDSAIDPSRDSYLEMAGKAINPLLEPLGFHWRASVAALAGVPAKEIVVSTLGVLYTGDEEASEQSLSTRLTSPNDATGKPDFTAAAALSFMIFVLLYCPCIATITAIVKGDRQSALRTVLSALQHSHSTGCSLYRLSHSSPYLRPA